MTDYGRQPENWESQQTQYIPRGQGQPPQGPPPQGPPPQYGQQPYYGGPGQPPRPNPFGAESNEAFGIVGTVCALLGFVVLLVGITGLNWFGGSGIGSLSFSDVHHLLSGNPNQAAGFATAYFGWLAWVFAIVGTLAAVGSCYPSPAVRGLRIVGVVIGLAAAGLSFLAIQLDQDGSYSEYIKHARAGFYLAVVGFVLLAVGAGIGTRKV